MAGLALRAKKSALIKTEIHFNCNHNRYRRPSVLQCRFKSVFADSFQGLLVEAHTEGPDHAGILGHSVGVDDHLDQANALVLGAPGFVGEFCLNLVYRHGSGDSAANMIETATGVAAGARPKTVAIP